MSVSASQPTSKIVGKTSPEFSGVTVPTLRAWDRYWSNPNRHKDDPAITEARPVATHLELIRAELKARGK